MALTLRTLSGKVDYDVEQQIREIVQAVNQREQIQPIDEARIAQLEAQLATITEAYNTLAAKVQSVSQQTSAFVPEIQTALTPPALTATVFTKPAIQLALVNEQHTLFPTQLATDPSAFTQTIASTLHNGGTIGAVTVSADPLWGRRRNDSGVTSFDVIAYKQNNAASNPYSVDIGAGAGATGATPQWNEQGRVGGTWLEP